MQRVGPILEDPEALLKSLPGTSGRVLSNIGHLSDGVYNGKSLHL
jgi:hypothetical protein